ncbi:MAG: hypothetical protein AAF065_05775 [Verrucomicrobiota bacterium]
MNFKALLSNEFVVLALDGLLHLTSVFVLGIVVVLACKLLSKGFGDAKLFTGLMIATLLVITRVFLLNNTHYLGSVDLTVIMALIAIILFLTSFVLVFKLVSIPVIGSILSSIAIVAAQLALAHYTPILSLKIMPEGQRFAEYAGVSNEKTKMLMEQAKNYQGESRNNIGRILREALSTIAFLSSDKEQEVLSKDLASGINFIQERRAFMESMSEDELAEYRAAMSAFMQEQGVDLENRYSLENLKNATPEDLQNLASFMKDMNKVYGFTDDLPEGSTEPNDMPPTLESLRQITKNLKGVKIGGENSEQFAGLLKDMFGDEAFDEEMYKVRSQISDLQANSGKLVETFRRADLRGMAQSLESATGGSGRLNGINLNPDVPSYRKDGDLPEDRSERMPVNFSPGSMGSFAPARFFAFTNTQSIDQKLTDIVIFQEPATARASVEQKQWLDADLSSRIASLATNGSLGGFIPNNTFASQNAASFALESSFNPSLALDGSLPSGESKVSYYTPTWQFSDFPNAPLPIPSSLEPEPLADLEIIWEDESEYFPSNLLSTKLTDEYIFKVPRSPGEAELWNAASKSIKVDAWFEGNSPENKGTIFVDGVAYRSGEKIERTYNGENYLFRFEGVLDGQIVITSLKREPL